MSLVLPSDLTVSQAAMWLDQQLFQGKPIYNTAQFLTIDGALDLALFEQALAETIAEHSGLRLPGSTGAAHRLDVIDFRAEKNPMDSALQWMDESTRDAIPLDSALCRFALIRITDDRTLWFQKYHHIITDATSRRLVAARAAARYRALRFDDALETIDGLTQGELLEIERQYSVSAQREDDRRYWMEQFSKWPGPLLEVDRHETERAKSGRPSRIAFKLKRADFLRLESAARELGSSAARAFTALAYAAFARLYDHMEIVLGVELAYRSTAKAKQTATFLSRPLPMLLAIDPSSTIADAIHQVDRARARNYPHRHYPVQDLARDLGITRKGHHGLFDVIVNYIPLNYDFAFEGRPVEFYGLSNGFTVPWLVTVFDSGLGRDLDVSIDTDPGLIPANMAERFASCLETLLLRGLEDPACPIAALPIMPDSERDRVLGFSAGKVVSLPPGETLASLCAAQAEKTPDAAAVLFGEQQMTFAELHSRATHLARRLAGRGVRPGVIVGIALPRDPTLIVAVLAVHKAGGAYLALDPAYPAERTRFMIADSRVPLIVTSTEMVPRFESGSAKLILVSDTADNDSAELSAAEPNDLAYVLYTSGSTGRPKAVGIEHRNLINLISWGRTVVSEEELHGLLFSTSLNFDLSAFEMFLPLAFGGTIILVENLLALASAQRREKVRLINSGPSLIAALARVSGIPAGVTTILLAGEKLSRQLAASLFEAVPGVRVLNCYGPTETTVYSTGAPVDPAGSEDPTLGRAIWNTTLYVLDSGHALVPAGAEGELFIGGAGVARGYLDRAELTAERFVPNPFGAGRIYRTGDRVRWRADGELDFVGRTDDQMKINGIRVEPGEIEAALVALPGIAAAAVKLNDDEEGRRLTAYLVSSMPAAPGPDHVRAALARQLPGNMLPADFVWLKTMPMTPNGKLDRKALPAPPRKLTAIAGDRAPKTRLERELAEIWQDVLGKEPSGVHADFFDLGGDSLALVSLFAAIETRFEKQLTVDAVAGGLTIARLAQRLAKVDPKAKTRDPLVALQPLGHLPPFFCVHGVGGNVVHLHRLAMHMGTDRPFFGLQETADAPLPASIEELAARYVAAVLAHQPSGPFYIGGHSLGATVAYEMARQLVELGHEIGLIAIIDQRKPGWRLNARTALPVLPQILVRLPRRLLGEFFSVRPGDRIRHMRRLFRRWTKLALGRRVDALSMFDLREPEQIRSYEAKIQALRSYRPAACHVPIALFRAEDHMLSYLALDATLGWGEVAKAGVRIHIVPGNHMSIAAEPYVRELAKALRGELDEAQNVGRQLAAE